jgi:hypothetical protein
MGLDQQIHKWNKARIRYRADIDRIFWTEKKER